MAAEHQDHGVNGDDRIGEAGKGNFRYVRSMIGKAIMNGTVSRTQVKRVSCTPIPDQTKKAKTTISNATWYLLDDMVPPPRFSSTTVTGVLLCDKALLHGILSLV